MIQKGRIPVGIAADMRKNILHGFPLDSLKQPVGVFRKFLYLSVHFVAAIFKSCLQSSTALSACRPIQTPTYYLLPPNNGIH